MSMSPTMSRLLRPMLSLWATRFLIDFWHSPLAALRRYSKRRTWPTASELDQMSAERFEDYMRAQGMVAVSVEGQEKVKDLRNPDL